MDKNYFTVAELNIGYQKITKKYLFWFFFFIEKTIITPMSPWLLQQQQILRCIFLFPSVPMLQLCLYLSFQESSYDLCLTSV